MICKHCGATIPENSKFCPTCGREVCKEPSSNSIKGGEIQPNPNPQEHICGYCGAKNQEDVAFCEECGAPLCNSAPVASGPNPVKEKPEAHKRNRIVGISIVAVVVAACIAIAVGIFGGRSYKSTVDKYIRATFEADGKTMLTLLPEELIKVACEEEDMTEREAAKEITKELEDTVDYYNSHYDEWSYSYDIIEIKDISGEDLRDLKENWKDEFDVKVKAAKTVKVEFTITLDGDTMQNNVHIQMIKVGNSWYVDALSMGGFF